MAGVAPEWKWNPNVNQMMQKPGDEYKKGFSVKCAIGGGKVAMWEQAGAGVWSALADLAPLLTEQPAAGQMPLIKMKEAKELKFTKGSTCYPIFEIVKWVDKPDCLKERLHQQPQTMTWSSKQKSPGGINRRGSPTGRK
jgi:hypothetical protein